MSDLLIKDTALTLPDFTLVSASAGSGKTFALTQRFMQLLLSDQIPHNNLRHILAITFTNNAAAEMKRRILEALKQASFGDDRTLGHLQQVLSLDRDAIARKAGAMVDTLLDNYSDFQVQTIDSFIARLVKVSALEFTLPPDFELVIESQDLLNEALDVLARRLVVEPRTRHLFEQLVDLMETTRTHKGGFLWNPYATLAAELKEVYTLLVSHAGEPLEHNPSGELKAAEQRIVNHILDIGGVAERSKLTISTRYAAIIDLAGRGDINTLLGRKLTQAVVNKSGDAHYEATVARLSVMQQQLMQSVGEYYLIRARAYYQPYVGAYAMLREILDAVQRGRGEMWLGEASRLLAGRLSEEVVPEVYYSLGERIHHYLIDEFQDTSPIQWAALRPLIENSLAASGSLFVVGDTKQSIYSFRGADWRIMKQMLDHEEFPSVATGRKQLETNRRSTEAIVAAAKKIFHEIVPVQEPACAGLSGLASFRQEVTPDAKGRGYVEVSVFGAADGTAPDDHDMPPEKEKLLSVLQDCRKRGFGYRDIAILTPRNRDVVTVSRWLNQMNIKFLSHSSLDIRTRKLTGELLSLLRFLDSPLDDLSFATFLLGDIAGRIPRLAAGKNGNAGTTSENVRSFILGTRSGGESDTPLYTVFREAYPELWKGYIEDLFNLVGYLPVYDLVAEVYKTFNLFAAFPDEEASLAKFLEVLRGFEGRGSNTLQDFLAFAEDDAEDGGWDIEAAPGEDAVTVMTVHKAKGLGFPALILLFYDSAPPASNMHIEEEAEGVRLVRVTKEAADHSAELRLMYEQLQTLRTVDDLNKLYVALTRAHEEMYILVVKAKRGDEPSRYLPPDGYRVGIPGRHRVAEKAEQHNATSLHVLTRGFRQVGSFEKIGLEETRRGDVIHAVLAQILFIEGQPEETVRLATMKVLSSRRDGIDPVQVMKTLEEFFRVREVKDLFEPRQGRRVLNEQEVVGSDGRLRRVDRLILDSDVVTVVDYKTGAEKEEYDQQISEYVQLAGLLYPGKHVKGVLAYVDRKLVWGVV